MQVTLSAQKYLIDILRKQKTGAVVCVYVSNPGTFLAKCGVSFCYPESFSIFNFLINFDLLSVRVKEQIVPFLKDSVIDLVILDKLNIKLTFKAPYSKRSLNGVFHDDRYFCSSDEDNSVTLEKKIKYVLEFEINPRLSLHGGSVSFVKITEDLIVFLRFSGGCNGCSMVNYTIKSSIELMLKKLIPGLKEVCDVTDHRRGEHSYY